MAEIVASRVTMEEHAQANEELRRTNEELQRSLRQEDWRPARERSPDLSSRDDPKPFSQQIMDELVPPLYITPKITLFTGVEDPENHLKALRAQMILFGGCEVIWCKMFMSTFTGTTLQWFSRILDGHITSFPEFSRMFKEQFSTNKVNSLQLCDLFNVRQSEGESLKAYLNRFCAVSVRLQTQDEEMVVVAFEQGMLASPSKNLMTFYGKCIALFEVINVPKDEYRSHKEQWIIKYNNR